MNFAKQDNGLDVHDFPWANFNNDFTENEDTTHHSSRRTCIHYENTCEPNDNISLANHSNHHTNHTDNQRIGIKSYTNASTIPKGHNEYEVKRKRKSKNGFKMYKSNNIRHTLLEKTLEINQNGSERCKNEIEINKSDTYCKDQTDINKSESYCKNQTDINKSDTYCKDQTDINKSDTYCKDQTGVNKSDTLCKNKTEINKSDTYCKDQTGINKNDNRSTTNGTTCSTTNNTKNNRSAETNKNVNADNDPGTDLDNPYPRYGDGVDGRSTRSAKSAKSARSGISEGLDDDDEDDDDDDDDEDDEDDDEEEDEHHGGDHNDDYDDDNLEDLNEENAFGYRYQTYLAGTPLLNGVLFVWHILVLVMGMLLIALGVTLKFYFGYLVAMQIKAKPAYTTYAAFIKDTGDNPEIRFTDYIPKIGGMLMVVHFLYCLCIIGYMSYSYHKLQFTLPILVIISGITIFAEITIVNIIFAPDLSLSDEIVEELERKAIEDYNVGSDDTFSISYDFMSIWFGCCGITDQYIYQNRMLAWFNPVVKKNIEIAVPPLCCKEKLFAGGKAQVISCAINSEGTYQMGCFFKLTAYIKEMCDLYSIIVWVHLADCGWHAVIYKQRITFLTRVLEYKNDRIEEYMRYLMKRRLKQEAFEMTQLFGPSKIKRYSTFSDRMNRNHYGH